MCGHESHFCNEQDFNRISINNILNVLNDQIYSVQPKILKFDLCKLTNCVQKNYSKFTVERGQIYDEVHRLLFGQVLTRLAQQCVILYHDMIYHIIPTPVDRIWQIYKKMIDFRCLAFYTDNYFIIILYALPTTIIIHNNNVISIYYIIYLL